VRARGGADGPQPICDLDQILSFLSGAGPSALFDLPWMPLYVGICFLFHPLIGIAAGGGALILVVLTVMTEAVTRAPAKAAVASRPRAIPLLEASRRNAEGPGAKVSSVVSPVRISLPLVATMNTAPTFA
jgi:ATP-binding cassette, subfamily C, type I secretion system permease/ATPase